MEEHESRHDCDDDNNGNGDNVMHACGRECGLKSLVDYFDVEGCDMWEGSVTRRGEV